MAFIAYWKMIRISVTVPAIPPFEMALIIYGLNAVYYVVLNTVYYDVHFKVYRANILKFNEMQHEYLNKHRLN